MATRRIGKAGSRVGLIKKQKKEAVFLLRGTKKEGDILMVSVYGYVGDKKHKLFEKLILPSVKLLFKKVYRKYRFKFDKIEAVQRIRWNKYGQRIN